MLKPCLHGVLWNNSKGFSDIRTQNIFINIVHDWESLVILDWESWIINDWESDMKKCCDCMSWVVQERALPALTTLFWFLECPSRTKQRSTTRHLWDRLHPAFLQGQEAAQPRVPILRQILETPRTVFWVGCKMGCEMRHRCEMP